jgi:hypothetical protein
VSSDPSCFPQESSSMNPATSRNSRHVIKRVICALLAIAFLATLPLQIVAYLHTGELPTMGALVSGLAALGGAYVFGFYAIKGPGNVASGVLAEPSEKVKNLAIRPDSKVEAIKAYREQTGVDVKRAIEVVERLASGGRHQA